MKTLLIAAAAAAAALAVGGCATPFGRAAVGPLKPIEVGIKPTVTCGQLVARVRKAGADLDQGLAEAGAGASGEAALRRRNVELARALAQADALYQACEELQAGQRVTIDLEAARALGLAGAVPTF